MPNVIGDFAAADDTATDGVTPPSQKTLDWLHGKASINRPEDIHHQLGYGDSDAASGSHTHDGKNSKFLFSSNVTLNDLPASPTSAQIQSAVNALNALMRGLGAS